MICPNCYNKIANDKSVCDYCKFNINELKTASNKAVKQVRKEGRFNDIIYTSYFPNDLNYKKTFYMAVFGGWFGLHNFYINKTFKAIFNISTLLLSFTSNTLILAEVLSEAFTSLNIYILMLYASTLIMWVSDLVALLLKKFKVPVVLKKDIKKDKKNSEK